MPKYAAIFGPKREFSPKQYPELFAFFEAMPHGARFAEFVIGFHSDETIDDLRKTLLSYLGPQDELILFQFRSAAWRLLDERDNQLRKFLEHSSDK